MLFIPALFILVLLVVIKALADENKELKEEVDVLISYNANLSRKIHERSR